MGLRRKSRECALQMLFQIDMTGQTARDAERSYWPSHPVADPVRDYAHRLLEASTRDRERIDALLTETARNWRLERMPAVDRALLRLAVAELLHEPDTPAAVVIDEAIEIARRYSTDDSAQFVNGVLDAVKREIEAVARPAPL